jgi:hypothetical protein
VRSGPSAVFVQLHERLIQFFKVLPQLVLAAPHNCCVSWNTLIDFEFLSQSKSGARHAAPAEEFSRGTQLEVYEAYEAAGHSAANSNNSRAWL